MNDQGLATSGPKRPTTWIVIAAILALAAIGLGIWGFTTKSDLDDANDTVASQKKQLAEARGVDEATLAKARRTHRRLSRDLNAEDVKAGDLRREAAARKRAVEQANANTARANSAEEQTQAALRQARANQAAAQTCAKGEAGALDDLLNAPTAKAGVKAATAKLSAAESACNAAGG
jgi:hypothetical protein